MKDFVKRITIGLEPLIVDLPEKKRTLSLKKDELENVSRFLAYVHGDVNLVGIYADQEIVYNSFDKLDLTKELYKASCYLLESQDENVKKLSQYEKAYHIMDNIIDYFKNLKGQLENEINELELVCHDKDIAEKYYQILSSEKPYIDDVDEFAMFLNEHQVTAEDKIDLLMYIIDNNVDKYMGRS